MYTSIAKRRLGLQDTTASRKSEGANQEEKAVCSQAKDKPWMALFDLVKGPFILKRISYHLLIKARRKSNENHKHLGIYKFQKFYFKNPKKMVWGRLESPSSLGSKYLQCWANLIQKVQYTYQKLVHISTFLNFELLF